MIAIAAIHIHTQVGRLIIGNIFITHTAIKTKSEAVSNFEPKLLTAFVFLAIIPSIISLKPQSKYMIWKRGDGNEKNSKAILPMMRKSVIMLAR